MTTEPAQPELKALIFDLMGTCTDWHSSLLSQLSSFPPPPAPHTLASLLIAWREAFFTEVHRRFNDGLEQEPIDSTHRTTLDALVTEWEVEGWGEEEREKAVQAWHTQLPWEDSIEGLQRLRKKYFVIVLANGTVRLQLDIVSSSGLPFHTLLSSELLGHTKPDPEIYLKALSLLSLPPSSTMMVAAHAYDLRAAAKVGMRTAYIRRWSEDTNEDLESDQGVRGENEMFLKEGGLRELAERLGC